MRRFILLLVFLVSFQVFSQEDAWVYLNAKPNADAFFSNPLSELSQRSLDRRTAQNISLDIHDAPMHQPYIDQIEAASGIEVKAQSKWFNAVHVWGSVTDINALTVLPYVDHVEFANRSLNGAGKSVTVRKSSKVKTTQRRLAQFNYGNSLNQIQMLKGHLLHQQDYTGSGKIIAVMDGGFPEVNTAEPFDRLRANNQILGGYDYVNRSADFYTGISHGTMVLSTMGGYKDGELVGTAPDASYYLFITEDGANEWPLELSLWVEAAEEADRLGVDILNTSLGYTEFDNPDYNFTYEDMNGQTAFISKGVEMAFSRGMISVNSAGNSGNDDWHYISAPADAEHALTVGAVDAAGNYASFSSQGPSFDGRVKPDVVAQGRQSVLSNTNGDIVTGNGTSFSGPIIAGMVACLWQALPTKTNAEIVQLIKQSASLFSTPNDELGYGIPDFNLALNNALLSVNTTAANGFLLYPNPAQNNITISLPSAFQSAELSLYNTLGQLVLQRKIFQDQSNVNLSDMNSGVYLYKIQTATSSQSGKISKQ
ncbi:S8 family serine peptidase [Flavobacterium sp. CYK-4]|uniref:S8 family serine peptidase n=1 Tax=Flavobacterium lotistagni TaxID=2709660 RepID=UPI00140DB896|nr:S8 family serine peptidase [Flavobacterium lotistagni]NHM06214.1 S8 family serine peptidase [Flavobacterium lotistagni]